MNILFCILSFLMGGCCAFSVTFAIMKKDKRVDELIETETKLNKEWMNFLNYSGGAGGQTDIE